MMTDNELMLKTASGMVSDDYKERFIAEYVQLKIRTQRLNITLQHWEEPETPTPTSPKDVLLYQFRHMMEYLTTLEHRATIENIELPEVYLEEDEQ